ncbi:MAG: hypothetical protein V7K97_12270 [Nostoc sp.]|uniref:hypothetical protein n=1 Tax=Nostoc sp. TaxID=1180 RepID=UPI002FF99B41
MPLDLGKGIFNLSYEKERSHRIYHATFSFESWWNKGDEEDKENNQYFGNSWRRYA